MKPNFANFSPIIFNWYNQNKRDLPWRNTQNPYHIWISEVILQQTRVNQGLEYYNRFVSMYPTIFDLANAPIDHVLKLWQGLGYYSRARNMHLAAKTIANEYNGVFPSNFIDLKKLKGIGNYTAAAIASIAYNEPVAVVDGNVYRVLARIFGIQTPIQSVKAQKEFHTLAQELMDKRHPGKFNQSLMEFGAIQCTPKKPNCTDCPYNTICFALEHNTIDKLPVKASKKAPTDRFFNYLIIRHKEYMYIKQRKEKDIWHSLFDFPLIETNKAIAPTDFLKNNMINDLIPNKKIEVIDISGVYMHKLTHQTIHARFYTINILAELNNNLYIKIPVKEISAYAVPRLIDIYIREAFADSF